MGKIKLIASLVSDDENLQINATGIKTNNKITYKENDIIVTILIKNDIIEMKRVSTDYTINLVFDKNKVSESTYQVFGAPKTFILHTKTNKLIVNENKIVIDYNLEGNNFSYNLDMEEL